jgi:2'-5' RNA ligase
LNHPADLDRYFVALVPPPPLREQIITLQEQIAVRCASRAALRSPPHLTLQPPFPWPRAKLASLEQTLAEGAAGHTPLPIQLSGYGAFAPRVIYIQVQPSQALITLQAQLIAILVDQLAVTAGPQRPFVPHLTLAFRDLSPAAFSRVWPTLQDQLWEATFWARALTLLRHDDHRWQEFRQFPLGTGGLIASESLQPP